MGEEEQSAQLEMHPMRHVVALLGLASLAAQPILPLAVQEDRCQFVVPTARAGDQFLLVVGSLACKPGSYRVTVRAAATDAAVSLPLAKDAECPIWRRHIDDVVLRQARARASQRADDGYPPVAPARRRTFHLFVGDGNFHDAAGYRALAAELSAVGKHCQVYVEADCADPTALRKTVAEAIRYFDDTVYPRIRHDFGRCADVDRDGRFTILFSRHLDQMNGGTTALRGFVRGADFLRDVRAPFGNGCDMMYLNAELRPGPPLRSLLVHEYVHAVVFSEHVLGNYLLDAPRREEESWLDEALAHVAEERLGTDWSNLDYRISAFLSAPYRYPLIVSDYHAAGRWRCHGCRGATFLFLHDCVCRDDGLPARLARSNLAGVVNLEAATSEPFAKLFRRWTTSLALGGSPHGFELNRSLGCRLLAGPRNEQVALSEGRWEGRVAGTAAAYVLLHSPDGPRSRVTVEAEAGADLQVSLIQLPADLPRLTLHVATARAGSFVLALTAHHGDVTLEDAAWERAEPTSRRLEDSSYRPDAVAGAQAREWFGNAELKAGATRTSRAIELPAGRWVFKVLARDAAGRPVAVWAEAQGPNGDGRQAATP